MASGELHRRLLAIKTPDGGEKRHVRQLLDAFSGADRLGRKAESCPKAARKDAMTTVEITLPDQLAKEAQRAGLLTPKRLEQLLREELKTQRVGELFAAIERMDRVTQPVLSPEDVAAEIAAMRAERREKAR